MDICPYEKYNICQVFVLSMVPYPLEEITVTMYRTQLLVFTAARIYCCLHLSHLENNYVLLVSHIKCLRLILLVPRVKSTTACQKQSQLIIQGPKEIPVLFPEAFWDISDFRDSLLYFYISPLAIPPVSLMLVSSSQVHYKDELECTASTTQTIKH